MDRVLTVWDFYDRPRTGIAEYRGNPHFFSCEWDESCDDYSLVFALSPVDQQILALALEQWSIWLTWEKEFCSGRVATETHPAFGGNNSRYDEIETLLKTAVAALPPATIHAVPTFLSTPDSTDSGPGVAGPLLVTWANAA